MSMLASITTRLLRLVGALAALAVLAALLVGVPWGLVTFVGWPLPDHLPSGLEIEATLLNPLSVTLLLDLLACLAWPVWLTFVLDVARCMPDAVRGVRPPAIGPVHTLASVLVTTAVLGLASPPTSIAAAGAVASTQPAAEVAVDQPSPALCPTMNHVQLSNAISEPGTVVVQPAQRGIHDSLWRIAERELGDGHRWHELYELNKGRPQADGQALTNPHLIQSNWVLRLPDDAAPPLPPNEPAPPQPHPPQSPDIQPAPDVSPERPRPPVLDSATGASATAITLWSGGLVGAALASAVALAMLVRRRKRLRVYEPGSGDRTLPPAPAPAVHALRLAYDEIRLDEDNKDEQAIGLDDDQRLIAPPGIVARNDELDSTAIAIGVRDRRARALDLAAVRGLGLTGAGAQATVRSLLVHLLGTTRATVVIPADDVRALLGTELPASKRLHVTDDLSGAITALHEHCTPDGSRHQGGELQAVLVAEIDRPHQQLQSLLDTGSGAGILLGHWPAGATVRVRADGVVSAASPSLDELRGSCLFHLDATDTRDLLALLAESPSSSPPEQAESTGPAVDYASRTPDSRDETEDDSLAAEQYERVSPAEPEVELDVGPAVGAASHDDEPQCRQREGNEVGNAGMESTPVMQPDRGECSGQAEAPDASDVPRLVGATKRTRQHPERPWELSIFGPVTLTWHAPDGHAHDITSVLAPKHKALLVFLALHPSGTTREAVREALWPDARGRRPFNAFYASLSQLRKAFSRAADDQAVDLISQQDEQISLDPTLVEVDYWHLHAAEHDRHTAATDEDRMAAWSRIAAVYRGEIADGMSALWLEGPREAAHRTVVDALAGMAAHYRGNDPQRQLQLLEHARLLNPENEAIYRDIMRVQAQLGFTDATSRTVQLLTATLAEIGERPDPSTLTLARALQTRQHRVAS
jgi:DNA-binding SARP family transcriptional activator